MATHESKLECPACGRVWWPDPDEVLGHRCPACGGKHLPAHAVEQVLLDELGWTIGDLRAAAQAGGEQPRACAACGGPLAVAGVEGVSVDLCARCGGVWLDVGELEALSHGRHREREEPPELAREVLPSRRKRVFVPAHRSTGQRVSAAVTTLMGIAFLPVLGLGVPMIAHGLVGRDAFVVDRERARVGIRYGVTSRNWIPFDRATFIDVVPTLGVRKGGEPVGYNVRFHAEWPGAPLQLFVRDRVSAHRYAFQLSQLTGVRVDMEAQGRVA